MLIMLPPSLPLPPMISFAHFPHFVINVASPLSLPVLGECEDQVPLVGNRAPGCLYIPAETRVSSGVYLFIGLLFVSLPRLWPPYKLSGLVCRRGGEGGFSMTANAGKPPLDSPALLVSSRAVRLELLTALNYSHHDKEE